MELKGKENENLIYYAPLMIFQRYKITIYVVALQQKVSLYAK
jgi:hypothetical protein